MPSAYKSLPDEFGRHYLWDNRELNWLLDQGKGKIYLS